MQKLYSKKHILIGLLAHSIPLLSMEHPTAKTFQGTMTQPLNTQKNLKEIITAEQQEAAILEYISKKTEKVYAYSSSMQEKLIISNANNNLKKARKKLEIADNVHRKPTLIASDCAGTRCPSCAII